MTQAKQLKVEPEIASLNATASRLQAETAKLARDTAQLLAENQQIKLCDLLVPFLAAASLMGATAAVVMVVLG